MCARLLSALLAVALLTGLAWGSGTDMIQSCENTNFTSMECRSVAVLCPFGSAQSVLGGACGITATSPCNYGACVGGVSSQDETDCVACIREFCAAYPYDAGCANAVVPTSTPAPSGNRETCILNHFQPAECDIYSVPCPFTAGTWVPQCGGTSPCDFTKCTNVMSSADEEDCIACITAFCAQHPSDSGCASIVSPTPTATPLESPPVPTPTTMPSAPTSASMSADTGGGAGPLLDFVANQPAQAQTILNTQSDLCTTYASRGASCEVYLDVPTGCAGAAGRGCPILIMLHGSGGNNGNFANGIGRMVIHATDQPVDFIGLYPQAVSGKWSTGQDSSQTSDDMAFINSIRDVLRTRFGWSGRSYAYGHSMGAAMANRLAVNSGMNFSGVACSATQLLQSPAISGPAPYNHNQPTQDTTPVAYLSLHGTADPTVEYYCHTACHPPQSVGGTFELYPVEVSTQIYADLNGCSSGPSLTTAPAVIAGNVASEAEIRVWACPATAPVKAYAWINGTHNVGRSVNGVRKDQIAYEFLGGVELAYIAAHGTGPVWPDPTPTPPPAPTLAPPNPSPSPSTAATASTSADSTASSSAGQTTSASASAAVSASVTSDTSPSSSAVPSASSSAGMTPPASLTSSSMPSLTESSSFSGSVMPSSSSQPTTSSSGSAAVSVTGSLSLGTSPSQTASTSLTAAVSPSMTASNSVTALPTQSTSAAASASVSAEVTSSTNAEVAASHSPLPSESASLTMAASVSRSAEVSTSRAPGGGFVVIVTCTMSGLSEQDWSPQVLTAFKHVVAMLAGVHKSRVLIMLVAFFNTKTDSVAVTYNVTGLPDVNTATSVGDDLSNLTQITDTLNQQFSSDGLSVQTTGVQVSEPSISNNGVIVEGGSPSSSATPPPAASPSAPSDASFSAAATPSPPPRSSDGSDGGDDNTSVLAGIGAGGAAVLVGVAMVVTKCRRNGSKSANDRRRNSSSLRDMESADLSMGRTSTMSGRDKDDDDGSLPREMSTKTEEYVDKRRDSINIRKQKSAKLRKERQQRRVQPQDKSGSNDDIWL